MLKLGQRLVDRVRKHRDRRGIQTAERRRSSRLKPQWIPLTLLVAVVVYLILFNFEHQQWQEARDWTGFGQSYDNDVATVTEMGTEVTGNSKKETTKTTTTTKRLQPAKTLWDWMTLLLAPATLAGLGFAFQRSPLSPTAEA